MNNLRKKKILVTHINAETVTHSDSVADVEDEPDIVEVLRQEESHSVIETSDQSDLEDEEIPDEFENESENEQSDDENEKTNEKHYKGI